MGTAAIVSFNEKYREQFKELNLAWIKKYFRVEQKDLDQVNNPEECLKGGGEIFFVLDEGKAIGTCALYKNGANSFELAKMAVEPGHQGRGLGDMLMKRAEEWAASQGATEILILSNTILEPAISLYRKHGFETTHLGAHPDYERCNIEMKKKLFT